MEGRDYGIVTLNRWQTARFSGILLRCVALFRPYFDTKFDTPSPTAPLFTRQRASVSQTWRRSPEAQCDGRTA